MATTKVQEYKLVIMQGGIETAGYYSGTLEEMRYWLKAKEKSHKVHGYHVTRSGNTIEAWKKRLNGAIKKRKVFIRRKAT